jgi:hypothetical protein
MKSSRAGDIGVGAFSALAPDDCGVTIILIFQ